MLIVTLTDRWGVDTFILCVCPDVAAAKDYCFRKHNIAGEMWIGEENFWSARKGNERVNIEPILIHNMGDAV